jgi:hypothetical protein
MKGFYGRLTFEVPVDHPITKPLEFIRSAYLPQDRGT